MLLQQTIEKLHALKLTAMARVLSEGVPGDLTDLNFEERLGMLVDREWSARQERRCAARLKAAKLRQTACIENIDYRTPRGLDRAMIQDLVSCRWLRAGRNVLITGPAGVGKSWLACALGNQACREGLSCLNLRVSRLADELTIARADGSFLKALARLAKHDLLILDDWGLGDLGRQSYNDLLEVLDDRVGRKSTLITSQLPTALWHDRVGDPTMADALLDRLVPNSVQINLKGESLRKTGNR